MVERQTPFTIYCLRVGYREWITTDIIEITAFCIFMKELGHADEIGESLSEIPLTENYIH